MAAHGRMREGRQTWARPVTVVTKMRSDCRCVVHSLALISPILRAVAKVPRAQYS